MARGSKSGRITPLLGEPFFTSAITGVQLDSSAPRSARTNPRGVSSRSARRAFRSANVTCLAAAATSSFLWLTIFCSISGTWFIGRLNFFLLEYLPQVQLQLWKNRQGHGLVPAKHIGIPVFP